MARNHKLEEYAFCGILPGIRYDPRDKNRNTRNHVTYMMMRCLQMFHWEGLPETIPEHVLEYFLQTNGHCIIAEVEGSHYAFTGGLGGEPNVYYRPTIYVVANPALKLSKDYVIDEECVLLKNDFFYSGLSDLHNRYGSLLSENDLSMYIADVNARIQSLISAGDDTTAEAARQYLKDVEDGKLGMIAESQFLDGLKSQPYGSTGANCLTDLIEYQQYLKASWFNELGLQSNYNMKREAINSNESQMNEDALLPLIDHLLICRQQAADKLNEMFGWSVTVSLASSWEDNAEELELEHEALEAEVEQMQEDDEEEQEGGVEVEEDTEPSDSDVDD